MFGRFIVADSRRLLTRTMHNSSASRTAPTAVRRQAPARRAISELVRLQEPLAATSFATMLRQATLARRKPGSEPRRHRPRGGKAALPPAVDFARPTAVEWHR